MGGGNSKPGGRAEGWDLYRGRKVLVCGLARSGAAAVKLLREAGAGIRGMDENENIALSPDLEGVEVLLGPFKADVLEGCEEVILSPGIPSDHPFVVEALGRGIPVSSELELGYRFSEARIIAVTGTNGKSTTVSMIGEILKEAGHDSIVAGNVGLPFCSVVTELGPRGVFVLEASSFQLESISEFHPDVAGLLNMTPDHLDRYGSLEDYFRAKERIIENCGREDTFVFNAGDLRCVELSSRFPGKLIPFSSGGVVDGGVYLEDGRLTGGAGGGVERLIEKEELGVVGLHNVENALAAAASAQAMGVTAGAIRAALSRFTGLRHRMEEISRIDGVTYYNDSKATNVEATVMSLKGLSAPVVLIAGGRDKGGDFSKLLEVAGALKLVVVIGEAAGLIKEALGTAVKVVGAGSMQEAVAKARDGARAGQLVILSPACSSFDMFRDFEHRGDVFRTCVKDLEKVSR